MELYNTCERMISRGKITGMQKKLDIFYAADRLTEDEYTKLTAQLEAKQQELTEKEAQINAQNHS
ncbi:hypothetical protein AAAT28_02825 [Faecalibacterium duncaniae]|uniref:hypothetical protein n=1 Tax=Faecalibacterium duncaniae (strain DSM 17677 / JCM 31915 / A2-165) TaxID=411483 RepID=UPI0032C0F1C8